MVPFSCWKQWRRTAALIIRTKSVLLPLKMILLVGVGVVATDSVSGAVEAAAGAT